MNKIIIIFLLILIVLGFLNNIIEYFRSKTVLLRKFEHNSFRHFNHLYIAIIFLVMAIWLFLKISTGLLLSLNILLIIGGSIFLFIAVITFYLYLNYYIKEKVENLEMNNDTKVIKIDGKNLSSHSISHAHWHKVKNKSLLIIWSNYEYVQIFMKDGSSYIITSLLLNLKTFQKYLPEAAVSYYYSFVPKIK
ncbi:MAG: hypothetical protein M3512_12320 [Bacteroidota bacterium]|nr:hypothetical protein [Bacteroidota bacterium]